MGWCDTSSHIPQTPGLALPSWGSLQPLTISTAVGNVAGRGLDPGHDFRQVSEARAGKGQHLWGRMGENFGGFHGSKSVRGPEIS